MLDQQSGELVGKELSHKSLEEVRKFYASLPGPAEVGIEASGQTQWFERLLQELGHQVRMGDAGKIRETEHRKQKTDRRDAALLLKLLCAGRFPKIWVPGAEERDLRQMLLHRAKLVRLRTQVKNQLQALALNQGLQWKRRLWTAAGRVAVETVHLSGPPASLSR
jgi:transposase